ncbi:hypothetical protein ANN_00401 [Periplaneta americana]|uniref:Uncharacterized protein n=1 Tax=Periplaneta americana TaxID=6978 RepID=A0ABQ8TQU3_PERAM|nr:hypothetical protein ANN_00401 [Periplaneta americana]
MPHTDTCKVCDAWLAKEEDIIPLDIRLHQTQATVAYSLLSKFRSECLEENCGYCLITYDLQKALPTPKIPTVPGHTFLRSDRDFGVTEKKIRKTDYVFTPDDWFRLVENSRLKNPFQVLRMGTEDFKNFHNAASLIVRNQKNALGRKMPLRKIAVLRIQATKPGILQYKTKYSYICPWEVVQVFYKPAGRPNKGKNLAMPSQETLRKIFLPSNMECLYPVGRKISAKKHKDLMYLLPYTPQNHHAVYYALQPNNLTAAEEVEDDPDN